MTSADQVIDQVQPSDAEAALGDLSPLTVETSQTEKKGSLRKRRYLTWSIERQYWEKGIFTIVGIDEAGRGPLAGPVVAGAATFSYETCQKFPKDLKGLTDSKQLVEREREAYFEAIKCHALAFGIGIVSPQVIDEINILRATMQAMTIAVDQVAATLAELDLKPEILLVDGNYFRTSLPYEFRMIVDGDAKSRSIAAASILAKVTRDHLMRDLHEHYPQYNFKQHKGYGTPEHRAAIKQHGPSPIHRMTFLQKQLDETLFMFAEDLSSDAP
jgi:ribonuclease HII